MKLGKKDTQPLEEPAPGVVDTLLARLDALEGRQRPKPSFGALDEAAGHGGDGLSVREHQQRGCERCLSIGEHIPAPPKWWILKSGACPVGRPSDDDPAQRSWRPHTTWYGAYSGCRSCIRIMGWGPGVPPSHGGGRWSVDESGPTAVLRWTPPEA